MNTQPDLTVIPMHHAWWHIWSLHAARIFVWVGFWIAAYSAWSESDWALFAISLMLLGIGLAVVRGVFYFMNAWTIWAQYISLREIREEEEIGEPDSN